MADPARRPATYEDLLALPPNVVGQILYGVLHAQPRPAPRHARATSTLGGRIGGPFDYDRGGPGGWVILDEPELHLGAHVVVPDLAGWRRERMPEMPVDKAYFEMAPDWVCEALSPSTASLDRGDKRKVYGEFGVRHLWYVDPEAQTFEVMELEGGRYHIVEVYSGEALIRAVPFDAVELELGALWAR